MKLENRLQSAAAPTLRERAAALRDRFARSTRPADEKPEPSRSIPTSASADLTNLDALALVAAIEAEWAAQVDYDALYNDPLRDDEFEAQFERRHSLIDAAEALPATRANLIPKALALAWIEFAEIWERGRRREQYATDGRLALDIDAIMRGGEASGGVLPSASEPARDIDLVGLVDFQTATIGELHAIYDMAEGLGTMAYALSASGRGTVQDRRGNGIDERLTPAGNLMLCIAEALTSVEDAAYQEMKRRKPSNGMDRETRLRALASLLIANGDHDETEAFALELLAHAAAERRGH